jgi:hypothetical protein
MKSNVDTLTIVCTACLLLASLPLPSLAGESDHASEEQVDLDAALSGLASGSFSQRELAVRQLWKIGLPAAPRLRALLEVESAEIRDRAAAILADFDYGITPDLPEESVRVLRLFRKSDPTAQKKILEHLCDQGECELLARLLVHIEDHHLRRLVFSRTLTNTPIMLDLIQSERLNWWLEISNSNSTRMPRSRVIADWLTTTGVLAELEAINALSVIDLTLNQSTDDTERNTILRRLLVHREFVEFVARPQRLEWLLHWIDMVPDSQSRHELLMRFLSMAGDVTLIDTLSLSRLRRFASTRGTKESEIRLLAYFRETYVLRDEVRKRMTDARHQRLVEWAESLESQHAP